MNRPLIGIWMPETNKYPYSFDVESIRKLPESQRRQMLINICEMFQDAMSLCCAIEDEDLEAIDELEREINDA